MPFLEIGGLRFRDLNRNGTLDPYEDWRLTPDARARDLVARMTLEEKAGTMMHGTARAFGPMGGAGGFGSGFGGQGGLGGPGGGGSGGFGPMGRGTPGGPSGSGAGNPGGPGFNFNFPLDRLTPDEQATFRKLLGKMTAQPEGGTSSGGRPAPKQPNLEERLDRLEKMVQELSRTRSGR